MNIPTVDLKAQYSSIKQEIDEAIQKVLANTAFIMGPEITGEQTAHVASALMEFEKGAPEEPERHLLTTGELP
jgi:hypothetical protein